MNKVQIARNPSTAASVLKTLAEDEDWEVRCRVALNHSTPIPVLVALAKDNSLNVRCGVANNPNTPLHVLESLAGINEDPDLRCKTDNIFPNTPLALNVFAEYDKTNLRRGIARNPSTPLHVLEILAGDEDRYVRHNVAANPNTPIAIRAFLEHYGDTLKYG